MIKKICNWTFGGFFRTLGRTFAFLLLGALFFIIAYKLGFNLDKLLGIASVKADTIGWSSKSSRIYYDDHGTEKNYNFLSMPRTHTSDYPITQMEYRLSYSGGFSKGNTYTFSVEYTPSPDSLYATGLWFSDGTNKFTDVNCSGWSRNNNGKYSNMCAVSPVVDISSSGYMYVRIVYASSYVDSLTSGISNFSITKGTGAIIQDSAIDIMNNQKELLTNQCSNEFDINGNYAHSNNVSSSISNGTLTVTGTEWGFVHKPINLTPNTSYYLKSKGNINQICIFSEDLYTNYGCTTTGNLQFNTSSASTYRITFYTYENFIATYKDVMISKSNSPYCSYGSTVSKLDNINDTLTNFTDTLTDDNISDSDVSNSLNFSTTENSYGPFATFLTLPLQWVQDILASNQSCSPLSLPLPYVNRNLVLPCMTEFWNSTGALGTLIQLCWIAVVGVRIFNGLFKLVVDTTSSEDNAEELTKIRSWEL